jgi:two-component system chemotaxis response regulator CheB
MSHVRVFVVDDSVVFRKLLLNAINSIPNVRSVGVASHGQEAIELIPQVKPDLITLDLNMPVMNGIETLRQLKKVYPHYKVIIISAHSSEGAQATLQALEEGALDFITKPENVDTDLNIKQLFDRLSSFISKYFIFNKPSETISETVIVPKASDFISAPIPSASHQFSFKPEIIAIAISTGGPNALAELLPLFPQNFPLPILIVQHMPRLFTKALADNLKCESTINIVEAQDEEIVRAGTVYIAPGGFQMKVVRRGEQVVIQIVDAPAENHCKPSADFLFRSVAQVYGGNAIGVIMTGMGSDGVLGLRLMKRHGTLVIAQDQKTSTIWGMPKAAIDAEVVDMVLSLKEIAEEIKRQVRVN